MNKVYIIKYLPSGKISNSIIDESRFYRSFSSALNALIEDYMQTIREYPQLDMEVDKEHGRAKLYEKKNIIERAYVSAIEVVD